MDNRHLEIDVLKGVAVLFMIIFHYFYMKYLLGHSRIAIDNHMLVSMAIISHTLFIFIFGMNMSITYKKYQKKIEFYKKQLKRFIIYTALSVFITGFTKVIFPDRFIRFGIFHFLAASIPLSLPFLNTNYSILGMALISISTFLINNPVMNSLCNTSPLFCFIMGLNTLNYKSIDHFSIIPYFFIVLFGIFVGNKYY